VKVYAIHDVTHTTLQDAAHKRERKRMCALSSLLVGYMNRSLILSLSRSLFLYVQLLYVRSSCQTGMKQKKEREERLFQIISYS